MSHEMHWVDELLSREYSRRAFLATAGGGALALALAACGGNGNGEAVSTTELPAPPTTAPSTKPPALTIRTWSESDFIKAVSASFTEETGIPVRIDTTDEGPSHAKVVQAIRNGERPPVDLSFQLQTRGFLNGVQGLSIPVSPEVATNLTQVSEAAAKPPELPSDQGWAYVNILSITVPLIYRTDTVDPESIRSWQDLWGEAFRDKVFLDGQYAGTVFAFAEAWDIDPYDDPPGSLDPLWDKYRELRPNIAAVGAGGDATRGLTSGQFDVAVYPPGVMFEARDAGAPVDVLAPEEGILLLGDSMYIHKNIPEESAYYAQVFINHALMPENQAVTAATQGFIPIHPDAEVPSFMSENPSVYPITADDIDQYAIVAPIPLMARHQDAWQAAFEEAIK